MTKAKPLDYIDLLGIFDPWDPKGPMIQSSHKPLWMSFARFSFLNLLKDRFFSIRVKGLENIELLNKNYGTLCYSNHSNWWDGQIAFLLNEYYFNRKLHLMIEGLYRLPILSKIGAFSVDKKSSAQNIVKSILYASKLLKDPANAVWLFPQGEVLHIDRRPIKFAKGVAYICSKVKRVNVLPISYRYTFLREDRPEVLIEISKPHVIQGNGIDRKELTAKLERELEGNLDRQIKEIGQGKICDYKPMFMTKETLFKRIERKFKTLFEKRQEKNKIRKERKENDKIKASA